MSSSIRPTSASPASTVIGPRSTGPLCRHHPTTRADYKCSQCGTLLCVECARECDANGAKFRVCACTGACESLEDLNTALHRPPLRQALVEAIRYPLRTPAMVSLGAAALLYALSHGAGNIMHGVIALVVAVVFTLLAGGYLVEFATDVVLATLDGRDELPSWPDFHDLWTSALLPFFSVFAIAVVAATPAALALLVTGGSYLAATPFAFAGLAVFLLACGSLAMGDGLAAIKPTAIYRLAATAWEPLFELTVAAGGVLVAAGVLKRALDEVAGFVPIVAAALSTFLTLYVTIVVARMLGSFLRERAMREMARAP